MLERYTKIESMEVESSLDNLVKVESFIDDVCVQYGINEDAYGNVLIAVTEAFNNAVQHGNANVNAAPVIVDVLKTDKEIVFSISDKGVGFDFDNLPDPTAPENIEKENGRGIFLMKNLADNVEFEDAGRNVKLYFNLN